MVGMQGDLDLAAQISLARGVAVVARDVGQLVDKDRSSTLEIGTDQKRALAQGDALVERVEHLERRGIAGDEVKMPAVPRLAGRELSLRLGVEDAERSAGFEIDARARERLPGGADADPDTQNRDIPPHWRQDLDSVSVAAPKPPRLDFFP